MPRRAVLLLTLAAAAAGCGGSETGGGDDRGGTPSRPELPGDASAPGAQVALQNGCLACHGLGTAGNEGVGGALDDVGARLSPQQIARSLTDPPEGMPSYARLDPADRTALVDYLAGLEP